MKTVPCDTKLLRQAEYLGAAHRPRDWFEDSGSEVAFAGRSNVGKSSAINAITGRSRLARTSKTPGRTQQIIFFRLDDQHRLVDLPGYGFAKVPRELQRHWQKTLQRYFAERVSLRGLVLPVDSRRQPTVLDLQMLNWCAANDLPVHVLLTKSDKLSRSAAMAALTQTRTGLANIPHLKIQLFSATRGTGVEEARQHIVELLGNSPMTGPS